MTKQLLLLSTLALLAGCDNQESQSKREEREAADTEMLKGEFKKSPVLDYMKYTRDASKSAEPANEPPKPSAVGPAPAGDSGFKKSPTLDYRKYLKEDQKP